MAQITQSNNDAGTISGGIITDIFSNINKYLPFTVGTIFFSTDTGNLYFGTPGFGLGYIQIGVTNEMLEVLNQILLELKVLRLATVANVCDGGRYNENDFNLASLNTAAEEILE